MTRLYPVPFLHLEVTGFGDGYLNGQSSGGSSGTVLSSGALGEGGLSRWRLGFEVGGQVPTQSGWQVLLGESWQGSWHRHIGRVNYSIALIGGNGKIPTHAASSRYATYNSPVSHRKIPALEYCCLPDRSSNFRLLGRLKGYNRADHTNDPARRVRCSSADIAFLGT